MLMIETSQILAGAQTGRFDAVNYRYHVHNDFVLLCLDCDGQSFVSFAELRTGEKNGKTVFMSKSFKNRQKSDDINTELSNI